MLSADELTGMRATVEAALPDRCDVVLGRRPHDGRGGWSPDLTPDVVATAVPCLVEPTGTLGGAASERVIADRYQLDVPYTVTLPHDADVRAADLLKLTTQGDHLLEVVAPLDESEALETRVVCRERG